MPKSMSVILPLAWSILSQGAGLEGPSLKLVPMVVRRQELMDVIPSVEMKTDTVKEEPPTLRHSGHSHTRGRLTGVPLSNDLETLCRSYGCSDAITLSNRLDLFDVTTGDQLSDYSCSVERKTSWKSPMWLNIKFDAVARFVHCAACDKYPAIDTDHIQQLSSEGNSMSRGRFHHVITRGNVTSGDIAQLGLSNDNENEACKRFSSGDSIKVNFLPENDWSGIRKCAIVNPWDSINQWKVRVFLQGSIGKGFCQFVEGGLTPGMMQWWKNLTTSRAAAGITQWFTLPFQGKVTHDEWQMRNFKLERKVDFENHEGPSAHQGHFRRLGIDRYMVDHANDYPDEKHDHNPTKYTRLGASYRNDKANYRYFRIREANDYTFTLTWKAHASASPLSIPVNITDYSDSHDEAGYKWSLAKDSVIVFTLGIELPYSFRNDVQDVDSGTELLEHFGRMYTTCRITDAHDSCHLQSLVGSFEVFCDHADPSKTKMALETNAQKPEQQARVPKKATIVRDDNSSLSTIDLMSKIETDEGMEWQDSAKFVTWRLLSLSFSSGSSSLILPRERLFGGLHPISQSRQRQ
eukprot:GHVH01000445.1.p1 GENE.GHVH01000445.1~~GHVH01000445.1.p1  ORF type:complete len:577 (+),score=54.77 GHVH01000445.1:841-2571(+)